MSGSTNTIHTVDLTKFYKAVKPNLTTLSSGIVFFNSTKEEFDNAFHYELQDLYLKSAVHANFVNVKANLYYGSGLYAIDATSTALTNTIYSSNRVGDTLDDVFKKACFDYSKFSAACFEVIYNVSGGVAEILHVNPANIRAEQPDQYGRVCNYYYSDTWGIIENKKDKRKPNDIANAVKIPAYNPISGTTQGRQLLYIKQYSASNDIYAIPSYLSSQNWINLDYYLSDYLINKLNNGYFIGGFLYIPSNMTDDEKDKFVQDYKRKHSSSTNSGKVVFIFNDPSAQKPEFVPVSDDLGNSMFKDLIQQAQLSIAIAHGGSTSLLGIDAGNSFGQNADANKLNVARLYFIDAVVKPAQNVLLTAINKLLAVNEFGKVSVHNEPLKLQQPIAAPDGSDLTVDERRAILYGLPPLPQAATPNNINPISTPVQ
ncbi:hypothetical protein WSM22_03290 [Cytophagales bacterium WSM2-2]|nr:hypothetical protein WSM22_03290 [Cytophagales bacterium WSM2-2]